MIKKTGELHTIFDLITNRMKNYMKYLLLLFFFAPISIWADTVPIEGRWDESDLRSVSPVPFTVEKEGNTLYIFSNKQVENVLIRIVSADGVVFYEDTKTFSATQNVSLSLTGFPEGMYTIEFLHQYGYLSGEFVN